MVGYLRGPRVGAIVYNVAHDLATGVAIAGVGLAIGSVPVAAAGAILVAHSGMDRMMGYGLKLPSFVQGHAPRPDRARAAEARGPGTRARHPRRPWVRLKSTRNRRAGPLICFARDPAADRGGIQARVAVQVIGRPIPEAQVRRDEHRLPVRALVHLGVPDQAQRARLGAASGADGQRDADRERQPVPEGPGRRLHARDQRPIGVGAEDPAVLHEGVERGLGDEALRGEDRVQRERPGPFESTKRSRRGSSGAAGSTRSTLSYSTHSASRVEVLLSSCFSSPVARTRSSRTRAKPSVVVSMDRTLGVTTPRG